LSDLKEENKMGILSRLQNNKGTVSSALGKALAFEVLKGDKEILNEAIELIVNEDKNVRSGAAKIIEMVAEKKPEYIAKYLLKLFPALDVKEAQTRWMIIHVLGLCAKQEPEICKKALSKAEQYLKENSGMCLWDRAITYLGYIGALSGKDAEKILPILEKCMVTIPERTARIFEGYERMIPVLNSNSKIQLKKIAEKYSTDKTPSVKSKANKINKILSKE
jgi:hypothetical protein